MKDEVESAPFRWVTRAGLAINGVLHLLVAVLAVRVADGDRERADQAGALQAVAVHPFGRALVWLVAAGFAAVVVWRVREAIWGFRHVEEDRQRLTKRGFSILQAMVFAGLAGLAGVRGRRLRCCGCRLEGGSW
jgi:hypothetical protein